MYDFDKVVDRRGTGAVKYEALPNYFGKADLLPLWVADMDFETPPFIVDAMKKRLEHPVFGYTVMPQAWYEAVIGWLRDRHGWEVQKEWLSFIPGIVKGIGMVVNALLGPDDKVVIQPPVYHPFRLVPQHNGRQVVYNPLILREDGGYDMDFENLETVLRDPACRLLILSNPHNPAGIVWPRDTLQKLAEICHRHHVTVISDEIHCDMALFGHKHVPFATVSPEAAAISITFGAPSKTFNIAGIVSSYAIVPDPALRKKFYDWLEANEFGAPDIFAPIATVAAYTQGEPWREELVAYLEDNVRLVEEYLKVHIPAIRPLRPQAAFLVWVDCRGLGLSHDALIDLFVGRAGLALNDGEIFGAPGWMRLNIGTPRTVLAEALEKLARCCRK